MTNRVTPLAAWGALVALAFFALAGVLFIQPGPESQYRLGLLFGVIGVGVTGIVAMLRADQSATNTNGKLDARIQAAVHRANAARRRGDAPLSPEEVNDQ